MNNIVNLDNYRNTIVGEEIGTVSVCVYKEKKTGKHFFHIDSENEAVLPISYVIEDAILNY